MDTQQAFYAWSESQQRFRTILLGFNNHQEAVSLFLQQHAMLHSAALTGADWTFADAVVGGLSEKQLRVIPPRCEHSVAWLLWHVARTEDAAMNLALAGTDQVLHRDGWLPELGVAHLDIGTAMSDADVAALSESIDLPALLAYRLAVGKRTREVVQQTPVDVLKQPVEAERIERVKAGGIVIEAAHDVADFWGRHIKASLLLGAATRHLMTHLNEARRMRPKLKRIG